MKTNAEVKDRLKEAFNYHKDEKELLLTTDGNIFLNSAKNLAFDHAKKTGGEVKTINRNEVDKIETISSTETKGVLDSMTVKEIKSYAVENRIELKSTKKSDLIEELKLALESKSKLEEE